ncbi:MAG: hypothetical protein U9R23_07390 [Candidatus Cloacimonadota bacterium]|nr:hypothetical protein [Candidatus Cloacimonadota bacterium]
MSVRSEVFKWLENHPDQAIKKGFDSNTELNKAFPDQNIKLLSKYKIQYNEEKKREIPIKTKKQKPPIEPKPKPEIKITPQKESIKININFTDFLKKVIKKNKKTILLCAVGILLLLPLFLKFKSIRNSHKK